MAGLMFGDNHVHDRRFRHHQTPVDQHLNHSPPHIGTGLIGTWNAFARLSAYGWVENPVAKSNVAADQAIGSAPATRRAVMTIGGIKSGMLL